MTNSNRSWEDLLPAVHGTLPGGADLRRTDAGGPAAAPLAILGVYPALTKKKQMTVGGTRMQLPTAVEASSFEPGSASGAELDDNYLTPLGLTRGDVRITDLLPYYLANTTRSSSGRSMADNIAIYERVTGVRTGIEARPSGHALLEKAHDMPGNLERLADVLGATRGILTLGTEAAAFVRGIHFDEARKRVDDVLYADPVDVTFLGHTRRVVHLVHPHLFIKRNAKWIGRHRAWCEAWGSRMGSLLAE